MSSEYYRSYFPELVIDGIKDTSTIANSFCSHTVGLMNSVSAEHFISTANSERLMDLFCNISNGELIKNYRMDWTPTISNLLFGVFYVIYSSVASSQVNQLICGCQVYNVAICLPGLLLLLISAPVIILYRHMKL